MGARFKHDADVITLCRLHEALSYAVALRTLVVQGSSPSLGAYARLMCPVGRINVRQPFKMLRRQMLPEAFFYRTEHNILEVSLS